MGERRGLSYALVFSFMLPDFVEKMTLKDENNNNNNLTVVFNKKCWCNFNAFKLRGKPFSLYEQLPVEIENRRTALPSYKS
jgi:hypothetical protein